jgi:hypothetical protein
MALTPPLLDSILGGQGDIPELNGFIPMPDVTPPRIEPAKHRNAGIPLLAVKTDLKSLKFGADQPGGGSSKRPFIQTPIPDNLPADNGPDFLTRQNAGIIKNSYIDVERLGRWFTTPAGLLFIAKQEILSRISVRTQASVGPFNDGAYNPIFTLFEAGVTGLGIHVNKQGLLLNGGPQYADKSTIEKVIGDDSNYFSNTNLAGIGLGLSPQNRLITILGKFISNVRDNTPNVDIRSYSGGPGSALGVGKTYIKLATDQKGSPLSVINSTSLNTWDTYTIATFTPLGSKPIGADNSGIIDFRKRTYFRDTFTTIDSLPYSGSGNRNIESRVNLGDPGTRFANRINYVTGIVGKTNDVTKPFYGAASLTSFDRITALPLYKASNVNAGQDASITNDLVQFRLAAIDGDNPSQKIFMHFRAFLDSISDNYTADWNPTKYVGRGENFYTYQGFDRKVSFGFTVAAQSKAELMPMYRKLNFLASNLAPDYSPQGYMRGSLMQLSIGGYFYEQPGFITSLNYEISQDSTWEIGIGTKEDNGQIISWSDSSVKELPHMIKVQVQFTPIHEFRPQKVKFTDINSNLSLIDTSVNGNYSRTRYIALANGAASLPQYNNYDTIANGVSTPNLGTANVSIGSGPPDVISERQIIKQKELSIPTPSTWGP